MLEWKDDLTKDVKKIWTPQYTHYLDIKSSFTYLNLGTAISDRKYNYAILIVVWMREICPCQSVPR